MMAQMKAADSYVQAVQALPLRLRQETLSLPEGDRGRAEELRLRAGWPMTAVLPEARMDMVLGVSTTSTSRWAVHWS